MKQPDYVASYVPYHIYLGSYLASLSLWWPNEDREQNRIGGRTLFKERVTSYS